MNTKTGLTGGAWMKSPNEGWTVVVSTEKPTHSANRSTYQDEDWQWEMEKCGGYILAESIPSQQDAWMMAAAKDMYTVIEEFLEIVRDSSGLVVYGKDGNTMFWDEIQTVTKAREALEKARGERALTLLRNKADKLKPEPSCYLIGVDEYGDELMEIDGYMAYCPDCAQKRADELTEELKKVGFETFRKQHDCSTDDEDLARVDYIREFLPEDDDFAGCQHCGKELERDILFTFSQEIDHWLDEKIHQLTLTSNPTRPRPELDGLSLMDLGNSVKRYREKTNAVLLKGYQYRYIYFIDKSWRKRLTVPEIPFSKIDEIDGGMYRGEKISIAERKKSGEVDLNANSNLED